MKVVEDLNLSSDSYWILVSRLTKLPTINSVIVFLNLLSKWWNEERNFFFFQMIFVEDSFDSYQNLIPGKTFCGQLPEK